MKKIKILLLNPPGEKIYLRDYYCPKISKAKYIYHPIDLIYLTAQLKHNFDLSFIDGIAEQLPKEEIAQQVINENPDFILFLTSSPSFYEDREFLMSLKNKIPGAKFIGIGDVYRELKKDAFEYHPFLDAILLDFSTPDILKYFNNENNEIIDNMIYKGDNGIVEGKENHHFGKFSIGVPKWELVNSKKYKFPFGTKKYFATILTDFGCAFTCTFCPMGTINFKLRETDEVVQELKLLKSLGIEEFFILDQTFGLNKVRTRELTNAIKRSNLNISFTCFTRVDVIDENLVESLKIAGCHTIMFGIETLNEDILKEYKKDTTQNQIIKAIRLCKRKKLNVLGTFIIGLPGETEESIKKTISLSTKLNLDFASFNIATPRFGTVLRQEAIAKDWIDKNKIDIESAKSMPIWKKQEVSNDILFNLQKEANRRFYLRPSYLIKRLISIRSFYVLRNYIREGISIATE